jgi:dihydroorotate dehydrogenase electron transfer subunit
MRTAKVIDVKEETPTVKSFSFHDKLCANAVPGQFCMVWIPRVDEVPMSFSAMNPKEKVAAITVEKLGEATNALHKMNVGDILGVRGPFGNGYTFTNARKVMIVGGGTGLASLTPLAEKIILKKSSHVTFLLGAKTRNDVLFRERIKTALSEGEGEVVAATEDGSYGMKGLVTKLAEQSLVKQRFDMVYTCGPEPMMYKMFLLTERFGISFQASLERFMRCAIGLCGTCVIGKYRICRDGPVFSGRQLHEVKEEFGHFRRGLNGEKISL